MCSEQMTGYTRIYTYYIRHLLVGRTPVYVTTVRRSVRVFACARSSINSLTDIKCVQPTPELFCGLIYFRFGDAYVRDRSRYGLTSQSRHKIESAISVDVTEAQ